MTDLHTHILPGMDDGSKNAEMSIDMLLKEREQGVTDVVLTPHFYMNHESVRRFLSRREKALHVLAEAIRSLPEETRGKLPGISVGAEVAWRSDIVSWPQLDELCYGTSRIILVELPMSAWDKWLFNGLYDFMSDSGFVPVIAHIERYFKSQKQSAIDEILSLGVPVQISAEALLGFFTRKRALDMLVARRALLISDCHNLGDRAPNIGPALEIITKKLGQEACGRIIRSTDELLAQIREDERLASLRDDN